MLTAEERREIDEEVAILPQRRSACIEALKVVQRHRRWVSDDAVADVAAYLGMSPEEVDSVATFYNLVFRSPVGRHVIFVCASVSCWVMGGDDLLSALRARLGVDLGGTTDDERFTLLPIQCLGCCDHAPALMIDESLYRDVTDGELDEILARYE